MANKYMTPALTVERFAKEDIMLASGLPYENVENVGTVVRFGMGEQQLPQ